MWAVYIFDKPCSTEKGLDIVGVKTDTPLSISCRFTLLGVGSAAVYLEEVNTLNYRTTTHCDLKKLCCQPF